MPGLPLMRRVEQLQQLDHPASAVVRPCRQVSGSLAEAAISVGAAFSGAAAAPDELCRLSDLAYGYRVTPRGLARLAASAGAMYPVELAWIDGGGHDGWRLRWFDPAQRRCVRLDRPARFAAEALGLASGQRALLLVAVAWRTIQRYGVRGYRYCLVDAGNVLGNVASVAIAAGAGMRLPGRVPHGQLRRELGLTRDELLLAVAVIDGQLSNDLLDADLCDADPPDSGLPDSGLPDVARTQVLHRAALFGAEQPPMLVPAMERIRRLHRLADPDRQPPLDLRALLGGRDLGAAVEDIRRRGSARAFSGGELDASGHAALEHLYQDFPELEPRIVARRDGRWRIRRLNGGRWRTEPVTGPEPDRVALTTMFGDQPLAATAPAFAVLSLPGHVRHGLGHGTDPPGYRQLLLTAGVAGAAAYQLAARAGFGTTVFGGFDDRRVAELAGGHLAPLVVQAFGPLAAPGADVKNDTVAATWLARRGNIP